MKKTKLIPDGAHLVPKEAKCVFHGAIHDVYQWQQKMFDGSFATFEMIKRADTVVVVAVEDDKLMVLKQIQPDWSKPKYGFPGGRVDEGETPLEAAKRELAEETGRSYKNWRLIDAYQPQEKVERFCYLYLATDETGRQPTHHEPGEIIDEPIMMSLEELNQLSRSEARLEEWKRRDIKSIEELLAAPEYMGKEVEI